MISTLFYFWYSHYSNDCGIDLACLQASGPYPDTGASMYREWSLRISDRAGPQSPVAKSRALSTYLRVSGADHEL